MKVRWGWDEVGCFDCSVKCWMLLFVGGGVGERRVERAEVEVGGCGGL